MINGESQEGEAAPSRLRPSNSHGEKLSHEKLDYLPQIRTLILKAPYEMAINKIADFGAGNSNIARSTERFAGYPKS